VTADVDGFVALTVAKFLEGAPVALKMNRTNT
jgi:hypothetical protein